MKVNNRRHAKMSRKASAILALCVVLVLTIAVGYLGVHGTWLDSRGLYKLLPWLPTTDVENWPQSIALGLDRILMREAALRGEAIPPRRFPLAAPPACRPAARQRPGHPGGTGACASSSGGVWCGRQGRSPDARGLGTLVRRVSRTTEQRGRGGSGPGRGRALDVRPRGRAGQRPRTRP